MTSIERATETAGEFEMSDKFLSIEYRLNEELQKLKFSEPVEFVYEPLGYAKEIHTNFVKKYFNFKGEKILFLGENPGPWGMCQTGVPFGDCKTVKDWFKIEGQVGHPEREHPLKKVKGLDCPRVEQSGKRFWGLIQELCDKPENFFKHFLIYNYCPLAFLSKTGRNLTPKEIKAKNTAELFKHCDKALVDIITEFQIKTVIGIGDFATKRASKALKNRNIYVLKVCRIPHPSPRNATDRKYWKEKTIEKLQHFHLYFLLTADVSHEKKYP